MDTAAKGVVCVAVNASWELQLPSSTVHDIVHKYLHLNAYRIQLCQHITPNDHHFKAECVIKMFSCINENNLYMDTVCFSDEATFHLCGKVNKHNCCIWGYENPQYERDTPKLNVWCGLITDRIVGPFFFHKAALTRNVYLDMIKSFSVDQILHGLLQHDGALPHYHNELCAFLNRTFPGWWMGRGGPITWPPRSLDLTSLDLFLWGLMTNIMHREREKIGWTFNCSTRILGILPAAYSW
jgi:hypothetical protein